MDSTPLRIHTAVVAAMCLGTYVILNLANPIHPGRDFATYFLYYRDFLRTAPDYPIIMLFRTPVAPLLFGMLFEFKSWMVIQLYFALSYLVVGIGVFRIVSRWSYLFAYLSIVVFFLYEEFFFYFNSVASENPTTLGILLWFIYILKIHQSRRWGSWAVLGFFTFILVLIRPNHQVLILVSALPLLSIQGKNNHRFIFSCICVATYSLSSFAYSSCNYSRYGVFEVAHLGPAHAPFYRLFIHTKMIRPEFGSASKKLGEIVREDVLTREVFKTYNIDEDLFWKAGTPRFWIHIVDALNHRYGYRDNNAILTQVSIEAYHAYPMLFWFSYIDDLHSFFEFPERMKMRPRKQLYTDYRELLGVQNYVCRIKGLENPGEDDLIPGGLSQLLFQENQETGNQQIKGEGAWSIPKQSKLFFLTRVVHMAGNLRPSISVILTLLTIAMGMSGFRDRLFLTLVFTTAVIVVMLCATVMANPELQFRFPFDPIFVMVGGVALFKIINHVNLSLHSSI